MDFQYPDILSLLRGKFQHKNSVTWLLTQKLFLYFHIFSLNSSHCFIKVCRLFWTTIWVSPLETEIVNYSEIYFWIQDKFWTWKDSDDAVCCTELFGFFWTLSIVWYVEVQWLRLALSNGPSWVCLPCPIHLRTETDPVSETLWSFVKHQPTRRWTESKRSQIVLYKINFKVSGFHGGDYDDHHLLGDDTVWLL
jgi:hypothetical protein